MTTKLEQAARALLEHWDTPAWKYLKPTGDLMADLREALAEQAEQEPVGKVVLRQYEVPYIDWTSGVKVEDGMKIYAAPVRTKDLTDDEIRDALDGCEYDEDTPFEITEARAVIAADREKNK